MIADHRPGTFTGGMHLGPTINKVICACGWQTAPYRSMAVARIKHEQHARREAFRVGT